MSTQLARLLLLQRKKWGLSQDELGLLLGVNRTAVSRYETGSRGVTLSLLLALEIIFGLSAHDAFPDLYERRRDRILHGGARLDGLLQNRKGEKNNRKRALLAEIVSRA